MSWQRWANILRIPSCSEILWLEDLSGDRILHAEDLYNTETKIHVYLILSLEIPYKTQFCLANTNKISEEKPEMLKGRILLEERYSTKSALLSSRRTELQSMVCYLLAVLWKCFPLITGWHFCNKEGNWELKRFKDSPLANSIERGDRHPFSTFPILPPTKQSSSLLQTTWRNWDGSSLQDHDLWSCGGESGSYHSGVLHWGLSQEKKGVTVCFRCP